MSNNEDQWLLQGYGSAGIRADDLLPGVAGDWVVRWTRYAELLYVGRELVNEDNPRRRDLIFEELGSLWSVTMGGVDSRRWANPVDQGRYLWEDVVTPTLTMLYEKLEDPIVPSDEPVLAWYLRLFGVQGRSVYEEWGARVKEPAGAQDPEGAMRRTMEGRRWREGARNPRRYQEKWAAGLYTITAALDECLAAEQAASSPAPKPDSLLELLDDLVQPGIAEQLRVGAVKLHEYRLWLETEGFSTDGLVDIDEAGVTYTFTELMATALPAIASRLDVGRSMLVSGPTSSGKSHIGRVAAAHILQQRKNVIVLLPTKALVAQNLDEWTEFFELENDEVPRKILPVSRDYPEFDDQAARGDFDIAIMIPEKLSAFLAAGMNPLKRCGLVVVDELQHLNARERGRRLEALLTRIRSESPSTPMLGLSATISEASAPNVSSWLRVDEGESGFISSKKRPVPLAVNACSENRVVGLTAYGESHDDPDWDLSTRLKAWRSDTTLNKRQKAILKRYGVAASLIVELLEREAASSNDSAHGEEAEDSKPQNRSILCFVSTRDDAEYLANFIRIALERSTVHSETSQTTNPYLGRFSRLDPEEAERREQIFNQLPTEHSAWKQTRAGLQTGVMYHTARLQEPRELSRIVERAYQDRLIRVLIATETLVMGLNYPAEYVIAANLIRPDGTGMADVLTPHDIAQRMGRCGRLFLTATGEAFVVVAPEEFAPDRVHLDTPELDDLVRALPDAPPRLGPDLAARALTDVDALFSYYLDDVDSGEVIKSKVNKNFFASLVLQDLARRENGLTGDEIAQVAARLHNHSLRRTEGYEPFEPSELLQMLERHELVGPSLRDPSRWQVSGLGRALSLSNLEVDDSSALLRVAEAMLEGAGPLTLLYMAARAETVSQQSWVAARPRENDPETLTDGYKRALRNIVSAFSFPDERERLRRGFAEPAFLDWLPDDDLLGDGHNAEAMRGRLDVDLEYLTLDSLNDMFRACVGFLWMRGFDTEGLVAFVTENTKVTYGRDRQTNRPLDRKIRAYPVDLRNLGELLSYVLHATAELLRVLPADNSYLRLKNIADSVEGGAPFQLTPLLDLRLPWLHRDRLAPLARIVDTHRYNDLLELLDELGNTEGLRTNNQILEAQRRALSDTERSEVAETLAKLNRESRSGSQALTAEAQFQDVPRQDIRGAYTFGAVADSLVVTPNMETYRSELTAIFEGMGIGTQTEEARLILSDGTDTVTLLPVLDELTLEVASSNATESMVYVLAEGLSYGARDYLRSDGQPGAAALSTWVLLDLLARLHRQWLAEEVDVSQEPVSLATRTITVLLRASSVVTLQDLSLADAGAGLPAPPPLD